MCYNRSMATNQNPKEDPAKVLQAKGYKKVSLPPVPTKGMRGHKRRGRRVMAIYR